MIDLTQLEDGFGHWLAGFADGEGCFRIHKERGGKYYACHFQIKLRQDDTAILRECRDRTGLGIVYEGRRSPTHPQAMWSVHSREGCWGVVDIFDTYSLRAKKARDYAIWKEALQVWTGTERGNRWHGQRDWTPIIDLKHRLDEVRQYPLTALIGGDL